MRPEKLIATLFTLIALSSWVFLPPIAVLLQPFVLYTLFSMVANLVTNRTYSKVLVGLFYGMTGAFGYYLFMKGGTMWFGFLAGNTIFVWFMVWILCKKYYYITHHQFISAECPIEPCD